MIPHTYLNNLKKWWMSAKRGHQSYLKKLYFPVMSAKFYDLKTENNKLIFTTSFYKVENPSVLHSGVYSKEFASMLLSGAVCMLVYMFTEFMASRFTALRYLLLAIIIIATFMGGTKFIFKEKYLEAVFDKNDKHVTISHSGLFAKKAERISFADIKSVELGSIKFIPENIDGINFVQKISLQHGSAVPGLGQEQEYITVFLKLTDSSERTIFAGRIEAEPEIPLREIRSFLESAA